MNQPAGPTYFAGQMSAPGVLDALSPRATSGSPAAIPVAPAGTHLTPMPIHMAAEPFSGAVAGRAVPPRVPASPRRRRLLENRYALARKARRG